MNRKKLLIIAIAIVLLAGIIIANVVRAGNLDNYALNVMDDGSKYSGQNAQSSITKVIKQGNASDLLYEVKFKNTLETITSNEISVLIDTSKSMGINDDQSQVKQKAIDFVNTIFDNNLPGAKISISANTGVRVGMTAAGGRANLVNAINAMEYGDGKQISEGITNALAAFSNSSTGVKKYLVIFTDGTDDMSEVQNVEQNGIDVITVLLNMERESYEVNGESVIGKKYMIDNFDPLTVCKAMDGSISNIKITDVFTQEILKYFDFNVESVNIGTVSDVQKTSNGYVWNIQKLQAQGEAVLTFKLTLNDTVKIDIGDVYHNINTSEYVDIEYVDGESNRKYKFTDSPIVMICEKYDITVQAVNEKSPTLPVGGIDVVVVGKDDNGNIVYEERTLTTDTNGKIYITDLGILGNINFTLTPKVNKPGYVDTPEVKMISINTISGSGAGLDLKIGVLENEVKIDWPTKRKMFAKIPIKTKEFEIRVNLQEKNNANMKIADTEFRLIQPKLDNKYELGVMFEKTGTDGVAKFYPTVMTKAGTYEYLLSQITQNGGFEPLGNVSIFITFDKDGNVAPNGVIAKYNDNATAVRENESLVVVNATNTSMASDTFKFDLTLNDDYSGKPIEGATYKIEAEGDYPTTVISEKTNKDGKILLDIPQSGEIRIKLTEESPKAGYISDTKIKNITLQRKDGKLQFIRYDSDNIANIDANDDNKLNVNLKSTMMKEPNLIQVQLVDSQEYDVFIPNAKFTLTSQMTGESYEGITNQEGIVNFLVQALDENDYVYTLTIDNTTIPAWYSGIQQTMEFGVHFGPDRLINDAWANDGPLDDVIADTYTQDNKLYHRAYMKVLLDINNEDSYDFKVKLRDEVNWGDLEGASYNIKITAGNQVVRDIKGRKTNSEGIILTRLIPVDEMLIEVQQVAARQGYKVDSQTQYITLTKQLDGTYRVSSETPYEYGVDVKQRGTTINGKEIIYYHTNAKKTGTDVKLNLHINKKDEDDNLIASSPIRIYSDSLMAPDGSALDVNTITDQNGYMEILDIRVPEVEIPGERQDFLYITETEVDPEGNIVEKPNTKIEIKLVFRYNEYTGNVELKDAQPTWGNRLVDASSKVILGNEGPDAYITDLSLDIYTGIDVVGNFSMDFVKKNKDDMELKGAKYDIVVARPDGTKLIKKGIEITDDVEFNSIIVSEGTTIEITESEPPIGYDLNELTDIIEIKSVDPTGAVTAELTGSNYADPRTIIRNDLTQMVPVADGKVKSCYTIELIDQELSTFKMGISTKDSVSKEGISGAIYRVNTPKGTQSDTEEIDRNGNAQTLIGANYKDETVEYTITQLKTGDYYKKLNTPIIVQVVFDEFKEVNAAATTQLNANAAGYGTIWEIKSINDEAEGTDISIEIINEPQDKLNVEIQTVDSITSSAIPNIKYKIEPSVEPVLGEGIGHIEVGYVAPNKTKKYTLTQITEIGTHRTMKEKLITVTYDENGNVVGTPSITDDATITGSAKTINVTVKLEPKVPFVIENIAYFKNASGEDVPVKKAQYEISGDNDKVSIETGLEGIGSGLCGILGESDSDITYHVKQTKIPKEFASMDDFDIKVHYGSDRSIDNVEVVGENKFVEVTYIKPSTSTDTGYNGNDKGIVKIKIKSYPALKMNIENLDRLDPTVKLAGTVYSVESTINTRDEGVTTNDQGIGTAYLDKTVIDDKITYTIHETRPAPLYQSMEKNVKIDVYFDEEGYIRECEVIDGDTFATVSKISNITTPEENFILNVQIKNNKILKFNIKVTDSVDTTQVLGNVQFEAKAVLKRTGEQLSTGTVTTKADGTGILTIDRSLAGETIIYTLTQKTRNEEYQFPEELKLEVTFDSNGKMMQDESSCIMLEGSGYWEVTGRDLDAFTIDVNVINNKLLKFNITALNSQVNTIALDNLQFSAKNQLAEEAEKENGAVLNTNSAMTDASGHATLKMDNNLANKKIVYTITQTRKKAGYEFPEEDMQIEVTFDGNGKMIEDSVKLLKGQKYLTITNKNSNEFSIDVTIVNKEIEQFGVEITTVDKYDDTIKLEGIHYDANLITSSWGVDENYTGSTTTDVNGQGSIGFDKYVGNHDEYMTDRGETRLLELKETNVPDTHRTIRGRLVINVLFDVNGVIQDVSVPGGRHAYLGWIADSPRFITVTHTRYRVLVTIMHFPYLNLNLKTEDMYTGQNLAAKYRISTHYGPGGYYRTVTEQEKKVMIDKIQYVQNKVFQETKGNATLTDLIKELKVDTTVTKIKDDRANDGTIKVTIEDLYVYTVDEYLDIKDAQGPWVSTGSGLTGYRTDDWIGYGRGEFYEGEFATTTDGEYVKKGVGPTEQGPEKTTDYYVYELEEPTEPIQYQKYTPRYLTWYYSRIIGRVRVTYDGKGRIEKVDVDDFRSNNNIEEGYIEANIMDGYNLEIKVKYAPITQVEVNTIDSVSRAPLSNTKVYPFVNGEYLTRWSYEYRTIGYYTTDANGQTQYNYWGANINDAQNEYHIDTSLMGYNGYFVAGLVKIKVAYDKDGRIGGADVLTTDENGKKNAEVTWENNKLKINILYNRRFNMAINKVDTYDRNISLSAGFGITSDKGDKEALGSSQLKTVGMVRPGETVKYTLSETTAPQGYVPIDNLDFWVEFNNDGSINRTWSNSPLYESVYERTQVDQARAASVQDLGINIKNEPRFTVKLNLFDKFYNEKKLSNVTFNIENSEGAKPTGSLNTNANGSLETFVGTAYMNKSGVVYTITQESPIAGYKETSMKIKLLVDFNENGRIKNYRIIEGAEFVDIDINKYQNQRYVELNVKATPNDFKLAIEKTDGLTNRPIGNVEFKVTSQEVTPGSSHREDTLITNAEDGRDMKIIDQFKSVKGGRTVDYTISEINVPDTYRKIQDVVIRVVYKEDGSIDYRNIISNPSNVNVRLALGGRLLYSGGEAVHMLLGIQNNNTYDLVIKNEDKNYAGLGIGGTTYDISINGETLSKTTNSDGIAEVKNRVDSGNIQIRISENKIGTGYKADTNNDTTINLTKGTGVYSLKLGSNSNPTYANVNVDETFGVVTVTFKNETKSSLTLVKDEAEVRFNITQKEKNPDGTFTPEIQIGTDVSDTEAKERLQYDLGVTPQNKIRVYKFEEVSVPQDYHAVGTFEVTVEFDMYGRIKNITDDNYRVEVTESPDRSNDIIVVISPYQEPEMPPKDPNGQCPCGHNCPDDCPDDCDCGCKDGNKIPYVVKIVSQDADTRKRIDESIFDININKENSNIAKELIGQKTGAVSSNGILIERGAIKVDNLRKEGIIDINVDQKQPTAEGYIFGKQVTTGLVKVEVVYDGDKDSVSRTPTLKILDKGGFEDANVLVDNTNKVITIKVNNEAEVMMQIKSQLRTKDEEGNTIYIPQEGIHYTITSAIELKTGVEPTDLQARTKRTDEEGVTKTAVGTAYAGKKLLYTISQEASSGYSKIDDIIAYIEYDTKGLVKYYEILSNPDDSEVKGEIGERLINLEITNTKEKRQEGYQFVLNKHHIDNGEYNFLLPGVKFKIRVKEEFGEDYEWEDVTDETGKITSKIFNGYGTVTIWITETEAREGFKLDPNTYEYRITRHETGEFEFETIQGAGFHFDEDNENIINIEPVNEPREDSHTIVLNKTDKDKNSFITSSPAEFEVTRIEKEVYEVTEQPDVSEPEINEGEEGGEPSITVPPAPETETVEIEVPISLGTIQTDVRGQARLENLDTPKEPGTYKYIIKETKVPDGYKAPQDDVELAITFDYNAKNNMIMTDIEVLKGDAKKLSVKSSLAFVQINNERKEFSLNDGEFAFNLIKVDSKTKEAITQNKAIFRLTDEKGDTQYVETDADFGKLQIPYMDMPKVDDFKNPDGTTKGTVERDYELLEIMAPEDYLPNQEPINIKVTFGKDDDGKVIVQGVQVTRGQDSINATEQDRVITFNIENTPGKLVNDEERGKYTINIAKVDVDTGKPVTGHATFEITLENGEKLSASTDRNGNIQIEEIRVPASVVNNLGPYTYVIEETTAADGYAIIDGYTLMEITFKEIIDSTTGKGTGTYDIDTAEITKGEEASILSKTDKQINIQITNKFTDHIVHYEANDSDDSKAQNIPDDQIKRKGEPLELTIKKQLPTRDKLVFVGWATDPNATQAEYEPGDMYELDEDITLYAIWKVADSTITYDKNCDEEVTDIPDPQKKALDTPLKLSELVPQRAEYVFIGWATKADAIDAEYQPEDEFTIDKDTTLYAVWEEKLFITSDEYNILNAELEKFGRFYNVVYDKEKVFEYNEGDKYITKITPRIQRGAGTTVEDFKNNIKTNDDTVIKVTKKQVNTTGNVVDVEVTGNSLIGTGMMIEFTKGKQVVKLEAIVPGDVVYNGNIATRERESGDGIWLSIDDTYVTKNSGILGEDIINRGEDGQDRAFAIAMDVNLSGRIDATDATNFKQCFSTRSISDLKNLWAKNTSLSK